MIKIKNQKNAKDNQPIHLELIESVAIFIDYHNLAIGLRNQNKEIDFIALRDYLSSGRKLLETFIYIGINPNQPEANKKLIVKLQEVGFFLRNKIARVLPDNTLKCNHDIEMVLDILEFVEKTKPNIVVLVTGDSDFKVLVEKLRIQGIRIEIASFQGIISQELKNSASGYIDLSIAKIEENSEEENSKESEVINHANSNNQW